MRELYTGGGPLATALAPIDGNGSRELYGNKCRPEYKQALETQNGAVMAPF